MLIISACCTGMKGFAGMNKKNAPEAYNTYYAISLTLARLGAKLAMKQMDGGRHFIAEHP